MKNNFKTIEEAKQFLKDNCEEGTTCPCCDQNVKVYKVKLTGGIASVLIKFYHSGDEWVHPIKEFKTINGDYAKLRHWGLLQKNTENNDPAVKASGLWRITLQGKLFVEGRMSVREHVRLYNNVHRGFAGGEVNIKQALGNKFNYEELMNN